MTSRKSDGAKQRVATHKPAGGPCCQVPGCTADLAREPKPKYCLKRRLCSAHIKADAVSRKGCDGLFRFCFQCGKLEALSEFNGTQRSCRTSLRQRREASCAGGSREPSCCAADEQPPKEEPGAHGAAAATAAAAQQANSSSAAWVKPELPGSLQSAGDGPCPPPAANEPVWVKPEPLVYGGGYDDVLACSGLSSCAAAMEAACEPFGGGLLLFDAAPMHAGSLSPVPAPALPQPCGTPAACAPACGGFTADSAAAELADAFCGASSSLSEELEAAAEAAYGDVARSLSAAFVGHDTADSADCNDSLYESLLQQLLADIQAPPVAAQHGSAALAAGGMPLHSHGLLAPAAAPEPAPQPVSHRRLQHLQQCFGQLQQMLCFGTMCCSQLLSNLAGPASF